MVAVVVVPVVGNIFQDATPNYSNFREKSAHTETSNVRKRSVRLAALNGMIAFYFYLLVNISINQCLGKLFHCQSKAKQKTKHDTIEPLLAATESPEQERSTIGKSERARKPLWRSYWGNLFMAEVCI